MKLDSVVRQWVMDATPFIKPNLTKKRNNWYVVLEEAWDDSETASGSQSLDECVDWVTKELSRWQGVRRMAWDQWCFDDKRSAEKFLTLFYMVWAK